MIPEYKFCLEEGVDDSYLPIRSEPKATGWDVRAFIDAPMVLKPFQHVLIPLGFRVFCPDGWWLELESRSSTFAKKHLNSLSGKIDQTYEGKMMFACQWLPEQHTHHEQGEGRSWNTRISAYMEYLTISPGDKLGQLIPVKLQEMLVSKVSAEEYKALCEERNGVRGTGGFGSTG